MKVEYTIAFKEILDPSELFVHRPRGNLEGRATAAEEKYQDKVKQFISETLRPDVQELLGFGESVVVKRFWIEKHKTPNGNEFAVVCTHGLLRCEGSFNATEILCMLPVEDSMLEKLKSESDQGQQVIVEKTLIERVCGKGTSYGGLSKEHEGWTNDYVDFSPDQQVIVQVGGWTHSAIERHDDNLETIAGIIDNGSKQETEALLRREIEERLPKLHDSYSRVPRQKVVDQLTARKMLGNDLNKKVFVSLGTMGALGADPGAVLKAEAEREYNDLNLKAVKEAFALEANEKITDRDIVMQPLHAMIELERALLKRGQELGVETEDKRMWGTIDLEGHSMGANVVARLIQTKEWKYKMELVNNDKYRVVLRNPVMWGSDLSPDELQLAHEFLSDEQIRQHVALHRGLAGALVRFGPQLMNVGLVREAAKILPVVEWVTDYYMGDLPPGTSKACHLETLENGRVQWDLNNRWLAKMGLIVEKPAGLNDLRVMAGQGRLAMVNGVGRTGDRILTAEAITLGAAWMGLEKILDSGDHVARPEYAYVWSLLWHGMLRKKAGGAPTEFAQFVSNFVKKTPRLKPRQK